MAIPYWIKICQYAIWPVGSQLPNLIPANFSSYKKNYSTAYDFTMQDVHEN